jgi:hypothetical protein
MDGLHIEEPEVIMAPSSYDNTSAFSTVYPKFRKVIRAVRSLPLSARSLLVKICQAQSIPSSPDSALSNMIDEHPDVVYAFERSTHHTSTFRDFLVNLEIDPYDPISAPIILDIARGVSLQSEEILKGQNDGWNKEVALSMALKRPNVANWAMFFEQGREFESIFPDGPTSPAIIRTIHHQLIVFKNKMQGRLLFPRATHKNMSRSTRREFALDNYSLDDVPIFGQDDWERHYHQTGIKVPGDNEMRQKWYPSGTKPRTYFAMGGTSYASSRFLQDFFSALTDVFPPTHHRSKLRPGRLHLPADLLEWNFRIYDLSSFTSNFSEQSHFMVHFNNFFRGVTVIIVDERSGPTSVDLGDLLDDYYDNCVHRPGLSLERWDQSLLGVPFNHEVASLLGIYGNMATCNLAHYLAMSTVAPSNFDSINVAGDDGLIAESVETEYSVDMAIKLIGIYSREKSFRGDEEGAICLKRPFVQIRPRCELQGAIIPPTVANMIFFLSGIADPRYAELPINLSEAERVSVIGKDLLRFLQSAWRLYREEVDVSVLSSIVRGFGKLVSQWTGTTMKPSFDPVFGTIWPFDPADYDFTDSFYSPLRMLVTYFGDFSRETPLLEVLDLDINQLTDVGDTVTCNSDGRLRLLERLGYLQKDTVFTTIVDLHEFWLHKLDDDFIFVPGVYRYTVLKDIPPNLVFAT